MRCLSSKCGSEFTPKTDTHKYCSTKCRVYESVKIFNKKHSGNCKHCGNALKKIKATCCKKCMNLDKTNTIKSMTFGEFISELRTKRSYPGDYSRPIRGFARSWNATLLKNPCQVCGYYIHIELAHRTAISSSHPDMTLGEINSPDNIFVLCRNHHWEYDNDVLNDADIPPRDKNT